MVYYTPIQAAVKLGVSNATILRRIRTGEIAAVKISQRVFRISEESLQKFIQKHTT